MQYLYPEARILVFARPPVPGRCKTRLVPVLGEKGAAQLQQNLTDKIMHDLEAYKLCPFELWQSDETLYFKQRYSTINGLTIHTQTGEDLGERMANAISCALTTAKNVIVTGSDCVLYSKYYLSSAIESLKSGNVVVGPASDGGYVLLATKQEIPEIFRDISWGTPRVLQQTLNKLAKEQQKYSVLGELWDIDTPEDLLKLQQVAPDMLRFIDY